MRNWFLCGGGWGAPEERETEMIQRDIDRGYISVDAAMADYGIRIEADQVVR